MFDNIHKYFHELGYTVEINIQEFVAGYKLLEFHYFAPSTKITVLINFFPMGAVGEINTFYGTVRKSGLLDLDLEKFIKLNFGEMIAEKLKSGPIDNFTEAIKIPIQLLEATLKKKEMVSILQGKTWNNKYYKAWHEGTDY